MAIVVRGALTARSEKSAEILIYESIGEDWFGDGMTARRFNDELSGLGELANITVRINSPGGAVFDGIAIYNILKQHAAAVHVFVDGLAASAASIIAMAGDRVTMGVGALMMVHNPWTLQVGDSNDMRKAAADLDVIREGMLDAYETRTGLSRGELRLMVDAETWLGPLAAIEKGFADDMARPKKNEEEEEEEKEKPTEEEEEEEEEESNNAEEEEEEEEDEEEDEEEYARKAAHWRAIVSKFRNAPRKFTFFPMRGNVSKAPAFAGLNIEVKTMSQSAADNAAVVAALAAARQRQSEIRNLFAGFPAHRDLMDECLIDEKVTTTQASKRLLDKLGEGAAPLRENPTAAIVLDERDKFVAGISNAILARRGIEKVQAGNEWAGASLGRICRAVLKRQGVASVDRYEGASLAAKVFAGMSTSDFPLLLANTANKALRVAYETAPLTYTQWCSVGEVSDFKSNSLIQLGSFNSLAVIPEGGEYKYGTFDEEAETIQAVTKGRALSLTRQMIINDDLGAFVRRASALGYAAARTVNEDAYAKLVANPTMSDTGALFNATVVTTAGGHANLAGTPAAITVASIAIGEKAMGLQKDKGLKSTLNIRPNILLTPIGLKQLAYEVLTSTADPASSNANKRNYAMSLGLTPVSDAALDAASATAWYLLADPRLVPVVEVAFLDGVQTPYTEEMVDFYTDAVVMKVRLDYGVAAVDWRGGFKNAGA